VHDVGRSGWRQRRAVPARAYEHADRPHLIVALGPDTRFLAVGRFDRGPSRAVHVEDACQLLTLMPGQKYAGAKECVKLIQALDCLSTPGIEGVRQCFIRQTVNTILWNSDAHLKNFSVLYHNGVRPELSPAYDIVCVSTLVGFRGFGTNVAIDKLQRQETLDTYTANAKQAESRNASPTPPSLKRLRAPRTCGPRPCKGMDAADGVRLEIEARLNKLPLAGSAKS
jgi:serine/threonine-protein kinase HipA